MHHRWATAFVSVGVILSWIGCWAASATAAPRFPDLSGHWAEESVMQAVERGFVRGYPDGYFRPDDPVTRAEFIAMLLAALGLAPDPAGSTPFIDTAGHWAHGHIARAVSEGLLLTELYGDRFEPDRVVTRVSLALGIGVAASGESPDDADVKRADVFTDVADLSWLERGYIGLAVKRGIARGYTDGTFRPQERTTRAEAVTMMLRLLGMSEESASESAP